MFLSDKTSPTIDAGEGFFNDDIESLSDYSTFDETFTTQKPPLVTRISRISLSPEEKAKRKEAFDKWLKGVNARERERKRLQRERMEAEREKKLEEEELRREQSEEKIKKWMAKKESEAKEKLTRLNDLRKRSSETSETKKPKELKKAIDFKEWLERKNEQQKSQKQNHEERKKLVTNYRKCRESTSAVAYSRWKESSRSTPKPVPFGRGLESLRGSTTKMFMNPIPWKSLDEE
jgi:coiled-coil domain-containing protein 34